MLPFNNQVDQQNNVLYAPNPSDTRYAIVLVGGAAQTVTVPTGANYVVFSARGEFWVNYGGVAATVPVANNVAGNASELSPIAKYISGATSFSMISPSANIVTLSFFS